MPIGKLFGITPSSNVKHPERKAQECTNFAKNSFNFGEANPNRPESRDNEHGVNLYCLA